MIVRVYLLVCSCCIFIYTVSSHTSKVEPCISGFNGVETSLICSHLSRQVEIDRLSNSTEDHLYDNFILKNSTVSFIPQQLLLDNSINSLLIVKSHLKSLFLLIPDVLDDLEAVRIEKVSFSRGLNWSQFQNLENVKSLRFRKVNIPSLNEDFQKSMSKKLIFLEMIDTNTSFISDNAFAAMDGLEDIRITNNRVSQLKRSMFAGLNRIETLFFNDNLIEYLPDDLFYEMPHLLRLGLENNNLSVLSEKLFNRVYLQITVLALRGNPIKCDCSLKWIGIRNLNKHHIYMTGACIYPKQLVNKDIYDLTESDFSNCQ